MTVGVNAEIVLLQAHDVNALNLSHMRNCSVQCARSHVVWEILQESPDRSKADLPPDFVPARPYPVCRQKLLTGYAGVRGLEKDPGFVLTTTCPRSTIMARLQLSRLLTISRRAWSA